MTRGDQLTMLRRRLQEDIADQWEDSDLYTYLNLGLQFMEMEILKFVPEAFRQIDKTDQYLADDGLCPMPLGAITILSVWMWSPANSKYLKAEKRANYQIDDYDAENTLVWAPYGRWIRYWPKVTATVTDGLKVEYVPTLTMGADTDVPDLHLSLHEGIVYRAQEIALGDTDETTDPAVLDALNKRLAVVVNRIPQYIQPEQGGVSHFEVDIDKTEGWM